MSEEQHTGRCLCGAVRYRVIGRLHRVAICHCSMCRRWHGHAGAWTAAPPNALTVDGEVRWYASSPGVRRGFCPTCGSSLFWEEPGKDTGITAGSLDAPTGLRVSAHIFCASKGDYYTLDGDPDARRLDAYT